EFDPVVLSDNCGAPMAVNNLNGTGTLDGYVFPIGDTEVIWTATDACGNMVTCSVTVFVIADPGGEIQAWVYLEGAAISTDGSPNYTLPMRTSLNDLQILPGQAYGDPFLGVHYTPPGQPYSGSPWFYPGTEGDGFDSG